MKKLIMWNLVTLDGFFEGTKPWDLEFHRTVFDEELEAFSVEQLKEADSLVFGSRTYKGMYDYWTSDEAKDDPVTPYMNDLPKIVCSTSLEKADWNNTAIVRDAAKELAELKKQGEGVMFVFGSANLAQSLIKANLFDEYRVCVAPVILGEGGRLFEEGLPYQKLELVEDRKLGSGGVILRYEPTKKE